MSYLVIIAQQGLQTRIKLGKQDNALRAIDWAIKNHHGVCVKEVSAFEMMSDEEHKRANHLWTKIDRET